MTFVFGVTLFTGLDYCFSNGKMSSFYNSICSRVVGCDHGLRQSVFLHEKFEGSLNFASIVCGYSPDYVGISEIMLLL